ncbi:MAG: alpha/beta fold hydrolase [Flavobacteriaceae bacterium]|nr:alpha/beta fold hydrolase [Flavobacteriaceae bacterium]
MELSLQYLIRKPKIALENPPLLILLHGYGSNEEDLFSFASELPEELLIVSARAPLSMGFGSYAWYTIYFDAPQGKFSDIPEAINARDTIANFIDEIKKKYSTDPNNTFLLGFSQGCILSLAVALNYPEKVQHVVGLSGYVNQELLPENPDKANYQNLDIYSSHGSVDQVIPVEWARQTKPFLDRLKIDNVYFEYPVGHGVAPQNFHSFNKWIKERI